MSPKSLNKLPKSDRNERLERLSRQALDNILPNEKFLSRDDNPDKGVDSSIEVIDENECFTNFRAQIQLKATATAKTNIDGSISYSIETSNLNYLWNNLTSIYVLYIESSEELRFVWLKDEIKRLNEENPNWQGQDAVTIRFSQILNTESINQIFEQIQKEGLLYRKIKETITINKERSSKFEIDSLNLTLTDQNDAKKILDLYGLELLNAGYELFVLEKYSLLSNDEKKRVKFLLFKSRAEGMLGKYRAALDTLGIIDSNGLELSPVEKFHFELVESHSNWQLGQISTEQFLAKLRELSTQDLVKDSILDRFNFLHFSLMHEVEQTKFANKLQQLKELGEEILSNKDFSNEIKVNIEFLILDYELKWLLMEQTFLKGEAAMYEAASIYVSEHWDRKDNFPIKRNEWVEKSNQLLDKTQSITTKADISYLQIRLWFHQNQSNEFWAINSGKEYFINQEATDYFIRTLETIINIYNEYEQHYSLIRAKMLKVEILSLVGRPEESEILRKQINKQANRMSYEALKNLTEFSLHKTLSEYAKNEISKQNKS